jgi:small subunit ribosomal protein S21
MARDWHNKNTVWDKNKDRKKPFRKPIDYKVMPVKVSGLKVWVQHGEVDKALRKFKKKIANSGKLQELKAREHYEKPSIARKRAKDIARKRHLKEVAENSIHRKRKY